MSQFNEFIETYLARIPRSIRWVDCVETVSYTHLTLPTKA